MKDFAWTDERCDELRGLWAQGWSASEVAKVIGATSRNAVIGKVHRLGLEARVERAPARRIDYMPRVPAKPKVARLTNHGNRFDHVDVNKPEPLPVESVDDENIPLEQRKQLVELEACHCRFPVGQPGIPGFFFCGHPTADITVNRPYCKAHTRRAKGKRHNYDGAERHHSFQTFKGKRA